MLQGPVIRRVASFLFLFSLILGPLSVQAEIVFEGFYRIERVGRHVGFSVVREEYDAVKKIRSFRYFVHTLDQDSKLRQIRGFSEHRENFEPILSDYREDEAGKKSRTQISFTKKSFRIKQDVDGKKTERSGELRAHEVLRTIAHRVVHSMSFAKGKAISYQAIRDDDGTHRKGQVQILDVNKVGSRTIFQIVDDYEFSPEESWVTDSGEIVRNRNPKAGVISFLVADLKSAAGDLSFSPSDLVPFFDSPPEGKANLLWKESLKIPAELFGEKVDLTPRIRKDAIAVRLPPLLKK